jgi:hypothetical protein
LRGLHREFPNLHQVISIVNIVKSGTRPPLPCCAPKVGPRHLLGSATAAHRRNLRCSYGAFLQLSCALRTVKYIIDVHIQREYSLNTYCAVQVTSKPSAKHSTHCLIQVEQDKRQWSPAGASLPARPNRSVTSDRRRASKEAWHMMAHVCWNCDSWDTRLLH